MANLQEVMLSETHFTNVIEICRGCNITIGLITLFTKKNINLQIWDCPKPKSPKSLLLIL